MYVTVTNHITSHNVSFLGCNAKTSTNICKLSSLAMSFSTAINKGCKSLVANCVSYAIFNQA